MPPSPWQGREWPHQESWVQAFCVIPTDQPGDGQNHINIPSLCHFLHKMGIRISCGFSFNILQVQVKKMMCLYNYLLLRTHNENRNSLVSSLRQRMLNNSFIHTSAHSEQNLRRQQQMIQLASTRLFTHWPYYPSPMGNC